MGEVSFEHDVPWALKIYFPNKMSDSIKSFLQQGGYSRGLGQQQDGAPSLS